MSSGHHPHNYQLITAREFAEMLGISLRALYRRRERGQLPPAAVRGGSLRWRRSAIEDWMLGNEAEDAR